MDPGTVRIVVGALLILKAAWSLALQALNRAEVRRHAASPPPEVAGVMDAGTYAKAVRYTLARSRFASFEELCDTALTAVALFSGIIPWLGGKILAWAPPGSAWTGAAFIAICGILLSLAALPLEAWEQFRLEAEFGFNRSTPALWLADKAKMLGLSLAIGLPLLWALLSLVRQAGSAWWVWGWALVVGFQIVMIIVYPRFIMPLFNKLEPLPEGALRSRLLALGDRTGFRAAAIQVMDGSRRSAHSNAFFTGFGRFRRIVLFDTLIGQLEPVELEAVLAHEIGHYRCGHIPKWLTLSSLSMGLGFAAVAWLARSDWFNPAFGFPAGSMAPSFLLFGLLSGLVTFWLTPLMNRMSRAHEYEADAFARRAVDSPAPLVAALRKLSEKNLSNLTPHPWFSAFHYSHPTLVERQRALGG